LFAPLLGESPEILVLGSLPSQTSIAQNEYYAHPRNSFWWIMGRIFNFSETLEYLERTSKLTAAGVAVWDVLQDCQRLGSLDSSIVKSTERANDFVVFLKRHPTIKLIAFNGAAAQQIFIRRCTQVEHQFPALEIARLPSSSPAHAAMTREQKLTLWNAVLSRI
jgi:TDG/mug DNA glycosylase family protein